LVVWIVQYSTIDSKSRGAFNFGHAPTNSFLACDGLVMAFIVT